MRARSSPAARPRSSGSRAPWCSGSASCSAGKYDAEYVARRWRVGWRHVEIGLDQVYTNVALSRLRTGLVRCLHERWQGEPSALKETVRALNKLLDLDLAIIEDAYQAEYMARLQRASGWRRSGRSPAASPTSCATRSTWSRLGLLPAECPQPHAREAGRAPAADRAQRRAGRQRHHVAVEFRQGAGAGTCGRSPIEPLVREALEINPPGDGIEVTVDCPPGCPTPWATATSSGSRWAT